ncbi:MAG: hypothetical protein RL071_2468 [Pseudomonadota bacterium]
MASNNDKAASGAPHTFSVRREAGRVVRWSASGRAFVLHGHRALGRPTVTLAVDGAALLTLEVDELRALRAGIDALLDNGASETLPVELRPAKRLSDEALRAAWTQGLPAPTIAAQAGADAREVSRRLVALGLAQTATAARIGPEALPRIGAPWTPGEDDAVGACWTQQGELRALAAALGRTVGAVRARAVHLGFSPRADWPWGQPTTAAPVGDGAPAAELPATDEPTDEGPSGR